MPEVVLIQLSSWGWGHSCSKRVEDSNKRIIEEIVHHVGYLPEFASNFSSDPRIEVQLNWKIQVFFYCSGAYHKWL